MNTYFYNKTKVAAYLNISRQYLHRLEKHIKLPGNGYRQLGSISAKEVDKWVKENWTITTYAGLKYFHQKQA